MGTRARSAGGRHTNLSFEVQGHLTTQAYSFVAANVAVREAWIRTSSASYGSDFARVGLMNKNGGHGMPRQQLHAQQERTQQNQKALHLLVLSGVVRPSYAKLRYAIPFLNSDDPSTDKSVPAVRSSSLLQKFYELMGWSLKNGRSPRQHLPSRSSHLRFRRSLSINTRFSP